MGRVADFGQDAEPLEQAVFGFYGHDIRVAESASELEFIDFMEEYGELDEDDPKGFRATKDLLRSFIHPDDFDTFWTTAKRQRQSVEQLILVIKTVVEKLSGRPTGLPSGSAGGRASIAPKSEDDSSSAVIHSLVDKGRPDLANMVVLARETISAG